MTNQKKTKTDELLFEIGCEELPAKGLANLAASLVSSVEKGLQKTDLSHGKIIPYVTPRRLAILVQQLTYKQEDQVIEKKGPTLNAAFDAKGAPTPACLGFAKSCGVSVTELQKETNENGGRVFYRHLKEGANVFQLMPDIIKQALNELPIKKLMRWYDGAFQFIRPVHWLVLLYGKDLIKADFFGINTSRETYGHRFHHPQAITIPEPFQYASLLLKKGFVVADFAERKEMIREQIIKQTKTIGKVLLDEDLLNEVTGLVEWPQVLLGNFSKKFLTLPAEALISVMQNQQRYFALVDETDKLLPHFILVSNIASKAPEQVIAGNERVIEARFNDIRYFYHADLKTPLADYVEKLKNVIYQDKLGTLYDKTKRLENLTQIIAEKISADLSLAKRAAFLAKADLMTEMVKENPELQGIMGYYYALEQKEPEEVALAIKEQYLPRFAGDELPQSQLGLSLSLSDRLDHLVGIFNLGLCPSGDKDPYALRRAALGIIRIILEKKINLDLKELLEAAAANYSGAFQNTTLLTLLDFIFERLRGYFLEKQNITANTFNAVLAKAPTCLLDFQKRLQAVTHFQTLPEAETLIAAYKRVNNILKKEKVAGTKEINPTLLTEAAERDLFSALKIAEKTIQPLYNQADYSAALKILASLKTPIDNFFDQVMVMVEDAPLCNNRLALLKKLKDLFSFVADLALL